MRDLTGQKFGKLTVIRFAERKNRKAYFECKCDCGTVKLIRGDGLISSGVSSCGCRDGIPLEIKSQNAKLKVRNQSLQRLYGITVEDYNRMIVEQDARCAICKGTHPGNHANFHVDHCHDTNTVRGLLCANCNTAIGLLREDTKVILAAADYISKYRHLKLIKNATLPQG